MPLKVYGYQKPVANFWAKALEEGTPSRKPDEFFLSIILKYMARDVKTMVLEITKLKSKGWKPRYNSAEATRKTVKHYLF